MVKIGQYHALKISLKYHDIFWILQYRDISKWCNILHSRYIAIQNAHPWLQSLANYEEFFNNNNICHALLRAVKIEHSPRGLVGTGTNQDGRNEPNRVLIGTSSSNTKWDRIKSNKIACRLYTCIIWWLILLLHWTIPCDRTLQGGAGSLPGDEVVG